MGFPSSSNLLTLCVQVAGLSTSSALGAFEKMEEKVMAMESEAEAAAQVGWSWVIIAWGLPGGLR